MSIENIKIENTQFERDISKNMFPFAITISNPEPLLRNYLMSITESQSFNSKKQSLAKKNGAFLDQNTKNVIRLTFKEHPKELVEFIQNDFYDWTARIKRFGLDKGIIQTVNSMFMMQKTEEKVLRTRKISP